MAFRVQGFRLGVILVAFLCSPEYNHGINCPKPVLMSETLMTLMSDEGLHANRKTPAPLLVSANSEL